MDGRVNDGEVVLTGPDGSADARIAEILTRLSVVPPRFGS